MLSGQHPDRPARATRGEPAVLRVIAPLALLVMIATVICVGFGFMLARQADNALRPARGRRGRAASGGLPAPSARGTRLRPRAGTDFGPQGAALRKRAGRRWP